MTPETAGFLAKARECLADAKINLEAVPRIAGREAYLAAYHAAEALIFERLGKVAKTHRGVRSEFARLSRGDDRVGPLVSEFLGQAYELKSIADYGIGEEAVISVSVATSAIENAARFVDCVAEILLDPKR